MRITRRQILALSGGGLLSKLFGATFEVDRLLGVDAPGARLEIRKYTASATVMLFSIPLVSRASVGSGYAVTEEAGRTISIQFGAGSYPESARGLNRVGFIQEAVVEEKPGVPSECAWLAFMTTSQEKNLDQAKKALEASRLWAALRIPSAVRSCVNSFGKNRSIVQCSATCSFFSNRGNFPR